MSEANGKGRINWVVDWCGTYHSIQQQIEINYWVRSAYAATNEKLILLRAASTSLMSEWWNSFAKEMEWVIARAIPSFIIHLNLIYFIESFNSHHSWKRSGEGNEWLKNWLANYIQKRMKINFNYELSGTHAGAKWLIKIIWNMRAASGKKNNEWNVLNELF